MRLFLRTSSALNSGLEELMPLTTVTSMSIHIVILFIFDIIRKRLKRCVNNIVAFTYILPMTVSPDTATPRLVLP